MNDHFVVFLNVMVANLYRQWYLVAIAKVVMIADSFMQRKSEGLWNLD